MTQWKPIDTAPKDGTEVLLWLDESRDYSAGCIISYFEGCCWIDSSREDTISLTGYGNPTHWMPLPEAPE